MSYEIIPYITQPTGVTWSLLSCVVGWSLKMEDKGVCFLTGNSRYLKNKDGNTVDGSEIPNNHLGCIKQL